MFKIKICGVTRCQDIRAVAEAGADAVGINFVPTSRRFVTAAVADELFATARLYQLRCVAVVMNPSPEELDAITLRFQPDILQLHGSERPEIIAPYEQLPIVKSLSWTGREEETVLADQWTSIAAGRPVAFLIDAFAPSLGGGTGKTADWSRLYPRPTPLVPVPLLLAGGLTPKNVSQSIATSRCDGVDTASGVESSPGIKDSAMIEAFVRSAKEAWSSI